MQRNEGNSVSMPGFLFLRSVRRRGWEVKIRKDDDPGAYYDARRGGGGGGRGTTGLKKGGSIIECGIMFGVRYVQFHFHVSVGCVASFSFSLSFSSSRSLQIHSSKLRGQNLLHLRLFALITLDLLLTIQNLSQKPLCPIIQFLWLFIQLRKQE